MEADLFPFRRRRCDQFFDGFEDDTELTRDLPSARLPHLATASSRIAEQRDQYSLPGGVPARRVVLGY